MVELPKTEEELQALIKKQVEEETSALKTKHNEEMYKVRKDYDKKLEDYKTQQSLTEEERAKKIAEEKEKAMNDELTSLRDFKKSTLLKDRLSKEGLPSYFANDNRLINAEEGELDKVIKTVKGEYEATLPKGSVTSTVVPTGGTKEPTDDKGRSAFAQVLEEAFKG